MRKYLGFACFRAAFLFMAVSPFTAHASTIQVVFSGDNAIDTTDGACSLSEAIIAANTDTNGGESACTAGSPGLDIIELRDGNTTVSDVCSHASCNSGFGDLAFPAISSEITIRGTNPFGKSLIQRSSDGDEMRMFFADLASTQLTLENIQITGGLLNDERAGAVLAFRAITIRDCIFTDNQGSFLGGGALAGTDEILVEDSLFEGNIALDNPSAHGGAILAQGPLTVRNSQFIDNRADEGGKGGAIANRQFDSIVIESSYFSGNQAGLGGAIIILEGGTLTLSDSAFSENQATQAGGSIYNESANDNLVLRTVFDGNQAANGGAISNVAPGAITVRSSILSDNSATDSGGAVTNSGSFLSESSHYLRNFAVNRGGAALQSDGVLTFASAVIRENQASNGGGLYHDGGTLDMSTVSLFENSARFGGSIYSKQTLTMANSSIYSNLALYEGGGLYIDGGDLDFSNGTIADNSAFDGGGIWDSGAGPVLLGNATISLNFAENEGGGIYSTGATPEIRNTLLSGNSAPSGPDCSGEITSLGFTFLGSSQACDLSPGNGDLSGNAGLGAFVVSSAPGKAHIPLLAGSPAIDQIDPASCPSTDQLGQVRNGLCDIGAIEAPPAEPPPPPPTPIVCGNGSFEAGEQCDDGNTADGDGCSANCRSESGFDCFGEPSICTPDQPSQPPPPTAVDSDGDGLPDSVEEEIGTDPFSTDSDGDGLSDFVETVGGSALDDDDLDGRINAIDNDSDNDGITDNEEDIEGDGCSLSESEPPASSSMVYAMMAGLLGSFFGIRQRRR